MRVMIALWLAASTAAAQPAHCERDTGGHTWPLTGDPIGGAPSDPIDRATARARVQRFRAVWRTLPTRSAVLRSFGECLLASDDHFVVRRISAGEARARIEGLRREFPALILREATVPDGWLWEVYWGGASRRHPPSGPISGYLSADGQTLIAAVQWPEG
jgi:hypothetical protein